MLSGLLKTLFPSRDAEQLVRARLDAWNAWLQPLPDDHVWLSLKETLRFALRCINGTRPSLAHAADSEK